MRCKNCGTENKEGALYCGKCGQPLANNSKKKKKGLAIALSIIGVCVIALGVVLFLLITKTNQRNNYNEKMSLGDKYFQQMKYEDAILAYSDAINIDRKQPEAYIALSQVYTENKNYEAAYEILQSAPVEEMKEVQKELIEEQISVVEEQKTVQEEAAKSGDINCYYACQEDNKYYLLYGNEFVNKDSRLCSDYGLYVGEKGSPNIKKIEDFLGEYRSMAYIQIKDNQIFYIPKGICRLDLINGQSQIIIDEKISSMKIYDGYIYYTVSDEFHCSGVWRAELDGSNQQCILQSYICDVRVMNIYNDKIYFVDGLNNCVLTRMSLDGSEIQVLNSESVDEYSNLFIDCEYIYYLVINERDTDRTYSIKRLKLDELKEEELLEGTGDKFYVYNDLIFYVDKENLCQMKIDGTEKQIVYTDEEIVKYHRTFRDFCVIDNFLIYEVLAYKGEAYFKYYIDLNTRERGEFVIE